MTFAFGDRASALVVLDPAVVVMDIVMPRIDGIELVRWLANVNSNAKVIIVTGFNPLGVTELRSALA